MPRPALLRTSRRSSGSSRGCSRAYRRTFTPASMRQRWRRISLRAPMPCSKCSTEPYTRQRRVRPAHARVRGYPQGSHGVLTGYSPQSLTVRRVRPARARALSSPQQDAVAAHCAVRAMPFLRTLLRTAAAEPVDDADDLAGEAEPSRARAPTVLACILPSRVHCTLRMPAPCFALACHAAVPLPSATVSLAVAGRATAWPRRMAPNRVPSPRPRQAAGGSVNRGGGQCHGAMWASHGSPWRQDAHGCLYCTRGALGRAAAKKAQQARNPSDTGRVLGELGAPPARTGRGSPGRPGSVYKTR
jgi:hypothetical protein